MFGTKHDLKRIFPYGDTTIKKYRQNKWTEGIHFLTINSRTIVYNLALIQDYLINIDNPKNHQKTIKEYMKQKQKR